VDRFACGWHRLAKETLRPPARLAGPARRNHAKTIASAEIRAGPFMLFFFSFRTCHHDARLEIQLGWPRRGIRNQNGKTLLLKASDRSHFNQQQIERDCRKNPILTATLTNP